MPTQATATGKIPVSTKYDPVPIPNVPLVVNPVTIAVKLLWSDDWHYWPSLELVRATATAGGQELGTCEIIRRYGPSVRSPHETAFAARSPVDLLSFWIKVVLLVDQGEELEWIGQIAAERREVFASADAESGVQHWIAYEPLYLLQKMHVYQSHWLVPISSGYPIAVERRTLQWIPAMNVRDTSHVLTGNRSEVRRDDCYQYGGTELWSRYDYLEYVLKKFVDESATDGPRWEISGQVEILQEMRDTLTFDRTQTVADIIRRIVDPTFGIDFVIKPIPMTPTAGFEVNVFALSSVEHSFGSATLPRNPNRESINLPELQHVVQTEIVSDLARQYDRINVIGARMVVCFSLYARYNVPGSLVPKWSEALEAKYKAGTGNPSDEDEKHDEARKRAEFDPVYQWFGAPELWDLNHPDRSGGGWGPVGELARPRIADDGTLVWDDETPPDYQNTVRRTLTELPLQDGVDYMTDPPTDYNPATMRPQLQRPRAFVWTEELKYKEVQFGVGALSVLNDEWGVAIDADPNHLLALTEFDLDADNSALDPDVERYAASRAMHCTIAMEADQRLRLRHELTSGIGGKGSEITISVPDAELWILAGQTIVGIDEDGQLRVTDGPKVVRNDIGRLEAVMAGAIARYKLARARADITLQGLWPYVGMLGHILDVVETKGDTEYIDAPVTSIEWTGGPQPMTTIRAGYAR